MIRWFWLAALLLAPILLPAVGAHAHDPSALWKIVNDKCVPHEQTERDPSPCSSVDISTGLDHGFAVLKDHTGLAQFLLIPTTRISGIDDPAIIRPDETNYWSAAWNARHFVEEGLHASLSRDAIALAINSSFGRTQDQLHIHIDCIRPDVRDALAANLDKVGTAWAPFPVPLAGHLYRAIRINQKTLEGVNPFQLLADAGPRTDMGAHTLAVIGETFADGIEGFVLLDDQADLARGDHASAEELQDHTCSIAPP